MKDILLLEGLVVLFGCGYVVKYAQRSVCEFVVTRTEHIANNIIPFFDKHPILGSKCFNYIDFKSALNIIKNKEYLNPDGKGLEKMLQLKNNISKAINNYNNNDSGKKET